MRSCRIFIHDVYADCMCLYQLYPQMLLWLSMRFYLVVCYLFYVLIFYIYFIRNHQPEAEEPDPAEPRLHEGAPRAHPEPQRELPHDPHRDLCKTGTASRRGRGLSLVFTTDVHSLQNNQRFRNRSIWILSGPMSFQAE